MSQPMKRLEIDTSMITRLQNAGKSAINDALKSKEDLIQWIIIIVCSIVIIYYFTVYIIPDNDCSNINRLDNTLTSFDTTKPEYNHNLRDYYIKASYNSCAYDDFDNTFVKTCALENVIYSGVRFLDFEIYSVNKKPVIAVSNVEDFCIQETYQTLDFETVMETVKKNCFSSNS